MELRVHPAGAVLSLATWTWELHRGPGNDSQLEEQLESYFSRFTERTDSMFLIRKIALALVKTEHAQLIIIRAQWSYYTM